MIEDKKTEPDKHEREDSTDGTVLSSEAKHAPIQRPNGQGRAHSSHDRHQDGENNANGFLSRLTLSEWLTFFVGSVSLVVSYFTYKNGADTSDLKAAVVHLGDLAVQAKEQTLALQSQIEQLALAQRAWLTVSSMKFHLINNFPAGAGIVVFGEYIVANIGHSAAQNINIKTRLFSRMSITSKTKLFAISAISRQAKWRLLLEVATTPLSFQARQSL